MPCGKRPLVKKWEKSKNIRVMKPSPYEQDLASVKVHWKNVIRDLELSYKDDKFWETQRGTVKELVGPTIFDRLAKIFELPLQRMHYSPRSQSESVEASEVFYTGVSISQNVLGPAKYSISSYLSSDHELSGEEEEEEGEEEDDWSETTNTDVENPLKAKAPNKSSISYVSRYTIVSTSRKSISKIKKVSQESIGSLAKSSDDLVVHSDFTRGGYSLENPHYEMLYCNESETDMIKWNSKYKQKAFEISASDEFSKKAELLTKMISKDFYDWWVSLGNVEFKSEIKRPEDIEDLFQVLFDEQASRGLILDPKLLPCVLPSIAKYVGEPQAACPSVLKRQIAYDILAETSPAHKEAFGTCLPHKMKHIPPNNDTKKMWHSLVIPEDLKTMSAVWHEIAHLTSTKAFHEWLVKRPHQPMAKFLRTLKGPPDKKQKFVVPSDFVLAKEKSVSVTDSSSAQGLALPISKFSLELKEVLSKLMND